ncbi:MAG: alpha/beta hydrolase [Cyanobacteria bacterium P01_C01_bin.120]
MFVEVNGAKLFFDVDGEGLTPSGVIMRKKPTVVMAHGGPGADHSVSKPYFSQLTDIAQVVYYDHRGNGRSDTSDKTSWNLTQWGDDLKGLCDALGIENPIVVGTSFGGFVTLSYATRHPDHAVGLVLISTAAKVEFQNIYNAFERLGGKEVRDIAKDYWENPTPESRMSYRRHCMPFYGKNKSTSNDWMSRILWKNETALWFNGPHNEHGRMDFRSALSQIQCPVLVMVGEDDPITPPKFSDEIVNGLGAEQVIYKKFQNCAHGVVGDKPDAALEALRHFICSLPGEY